MANPILPWFIVDYDNYDIITLPNVPKEISSNKDVSLSEVKNPGNRTSSIQFGGMGPKKLTFTIDLLKKSNTVGNLPQLKQFEQLRSPNEGVTQWIKRAIGQATNMANPRVLYWYGSGQFMPLVYFVKKVDMKNMYWNTMGFAQHSTIDLELWLDEDHVLNEIEVIASSLIKLLGTVEGIVGLVRKLARSGNPYVSFLNISSSGG